MSLLTHFIAADVRRLRLTIALWVSALLVEAALAQVASFVPDASPGGLVLRVAGLPLWIATALLAWALVPFVLQLHPAVGSNAFWMTRPIAPPLLVAAKLLVLLLVFIGVPLAIEQVVMIVNRVPAGDLGRAGLQTALYRGVLMAALAAPAALTPNLARFALLCGGALFAFALMPVLSFSIEALAGSRAPRFLVDITANTAVDVPRPEADATWQVVGSVLLFCTGVAAVTVQYAKRRARDTVAIAIVGLTLAVLVSVNWPWPVMRASLTPPEWANAAGTLRLTATISGTKYNPAEELYQREPVWMAHIPLTMMSPGSGWVATARVTHARVDVAGTVLSTTNEFPVGTALPDDTGERPGRPAFRRVLDVDRLLESGLLENQTPTGGLTVRMPVEMAARAPTAHVTAEFLVDLAKLDIASVMPLGRGLFREGAYSVSVREVNEMPTGVLANVRVAHVSTMFDRRARPIYLYFLRNMRSREAVRGALGGGGYSVGFAQTPHVAAPQSPSGGFSVASQTLVFDGRDPNTKDTRSLLTRAWLRDAELVIVRVTHQGSVRRTLELKELPLVK